MILLISWAILLFSCRIEKTVGIPVKDSITIKVNTNSIIATGVSNKYGLNLNAGIDADVNRPADSRSLVEAIKDIGAKYLRYPGGKKSLYYFWAADPYTDPASNYWAPGRYAEYAKNTINFDQFISICNQTDATPHINVGYNPEVGLNETVAAEWVRYANITKGYGIKHWEIGNEMWQDELGFTTNTLAALVKMYSKAMKSIDPSIKIGVSWNDLPAIIQECDSFIDFVSISNYEHGNVGIKSYNAYATKGDVNFLKIDENISKKIVVSEFSPILWDNSDWDATNNLGKGLMNFDFVGQILKSEKCEYACFWNTRWYTDSKPVYNALDDKNDLTPIAKSLVLWRMFIKDKLVCATSTEGSIVSYASYDSDNGDLNIFLINKATSSKDVTVNVKSDFTYSTTFDIWQYKGNGYTYVNPVVENVGKANIKDNIIEAFTLPSTSITTFVLKAK